MAFNGSNIGENMDVSANGGRVRFTRNVGNITMDLDDVESIVAKTLGGADNVTSTTCPEPMSPTWSPTSPPSAAATTPQPDNVVANATNGDDVVSVIGAGPNAQVSGLPALVSVSGRRRRQRSVTVKALAGADVVDATSLAAAAALLTWTAATVTTCCSAVPGTTRSSAARATTC